VRFFHIDGGHNANEALSDLELAAATLVEDGIVAIDDAFRFDWPGVTEAIIRFLDRHQDFRPVVAAFNKLLLARVGALDLYRGVVDPGLRERYDLGYPWSVKRLPFVSGEVTIFYIPTTLRRRWLNTHLLRLYRRHAWLRKAWLAPARRLGRALLH
jgi:hypothetical protein